MVAKAPVAGLANAPGPTPAVHVKHVEFSNSHTIARDYGGTVYPPIWHDANDDGDADDWGAGDVRAPICYTAPQPLTVSAVVFRVDPAFSVDVSNATAIGAILGTVDVFSSTSLSYNGAGTELTATMTGTASTWTTIAYVADYEITWRIQNASGTYSAGTSSNPAYWVLAPPTGSFTFYYSLVHIACSMGHGLDGSSEVAVADAIFQEFSDQVVYRATDQLEGLPLMALTYYQNWVCGNLTVQSLLATRDGQCGAWAMFFIRCLHAAGVDPFNELVKVESIDSPNIFGAGAPFLVHSWGFGATSNSDPWTQNYPHLNIWDSPEIVANTYQWLFADVNDQIGVSGQGPTPDPASYFGVHFIVDVTGKYFDPSYGNSYGSFGGFESAAIAGYGLDFRTGNRAYNVDESDFGIDFNGNGTTTDSSVPVPGVVIRQNPAGNQLQQAAAEISR